MQIFFFHIYDLKSKWKNLINFEANVKTKAWERFNYLALVSKRNHIKIKHKKTKLMAFFI